MKAGVIITGMGTITPIGNDVESFWQGLKDKTAGIAPITYSDITDYKCKLAAEAKGFNAKDYMDAETARRMEAFSQLTVAVSRETLEHSGTDMGKEDPCRVGVCVGSGIGSPQAMEKDIQKLLEKGPSRVNPLLVPLMISNIVTGNVAVQFGLKGKCFDVVTACATDTHSVGEAFRSVQYGETDMMVVGGAEANIALIGITGFTSLIALNTTNDPERMSIPLGRDRSGFVMNEGADVMVLGSLDHAKTRGANILAEVVGYDATCDTYHITSSAEDGSSAAHAVEDTIKDAGIQPEDIDYVNAHGTSTHHSDLFETKAIKLALRDHTGKIKINSTKSMVGHLLGAAGGAEFTTYIKSIGDGYIHATAGLEEPGEGCNLGYTAEDGVTMDANVTINSSLDFGGRNASLIIRRFSE